MRARGGGTGRKRGAGVGSSSSAEARPGQRPGHRGGWPPTAIRDVLLVVLTLTTGAVDATAFLTLGNVFSSVITGNLVLLGLAAGDQAASPALHAGLALAGYSAGVAVAAPIAASGRDDGQAWPVSVTVTLLAELALLLAFSLTWELAPAAGQVTGGAQLGLLILLAAAMGMQSAAVRRLGQMSTTYLTSTLTGLVTAAVTGRAQPGTGRSGGVLVTLVTGATLAALVRGHAPAWLPLVVAAPAVTVTGIALAWRDRLRKPSRDDPNAARSASPGDRADGSDRRS